MASTAAGAGSLALSAGAQQANEGGGVAFNHGVASGDPLVDRVILWTRVTSANDGPLSVDWSVATDTGFNEIVKSGTVTTDSSRDYTVKVDADGLRPGQEYYYRFAVGDKLSPLGRTKTLPSGEVDKLRLAIVSCSNYPAGYFNVYNAIGRRSDIDAVLHLGDYIYEYPLGGYGMETPNNMARAERLERLPVPEHETITLDDYRARHAQYKSDRDLQLAHASAPFICIWDDHEVANDGWLGGAENHNADEGDWADRRAAGVKAYFEWMPIRAPEDRTHLEIYRSFEFGDLASLFMLETRLSARSPGLRTSSDMPMIRIPFDFTDPQNPVPLDVKSKNPVDPSKLRLIQLPFDLSSGAPIPVLDYAKVTAWGNNLPKGYRFLPDTELFREMIKDETRMMMGPAQESWLKAGLQSSKNRGVPWQVIGNQCLVAPIITPNLAAKLSDDEKARVPEAFRQRLEFASRLEMPLNLDAWDGYPAARTRLLETFKQHANNTLLYAGDSHNAWANELSFKGSKEIIAAEFGSPSITSSGIGDFVPLDRGRVERLLMDKNPHIKFCNVNDRGYLVVTLTPEEAITAFHFIDVQDTEDYMQAIPLAMRVKKTDGPGVAAMEPLQPI